MADKQYKYATNDDLIYLVNALLQKLKNSPLADNTTYTLAMNYNNMQLDLTDGDGNVVSSVKGKLTTNDLTDTLKAKYDKAATQVQELTDAGAEKNKLESVTFNGTKLAIDKDKNVSIEAVVADDLKPYAKTATYDADGDGIVDNAAAVNGHTLGMDVPEGSKLTDTVYDDTAVRKLIAGKADSSAVPTSVSQLANDSKYQTKNDVDSAIASAVAGIVQFQFQKVTVLPETGEKGIIYLLPTATTGDKNIYAEYIWTGTTYEELGVQLDLSGYLTSDDVVELTNAEMTSIVDTAYTQVFGA